MQIRRALASPTILVINSIAQNSGNRLAKANPSKTSFCLFIGCRIKYRPKRSFGHPYYARQSVDDHHYTPYQQNLEP